MREVLKLPAFRRLAVVSMINELALSIGAVALALLVYRRTGSAIGAMAYFLCAEFGPALISPFVVARLDQRAARRVLPPLYVLEALIFAVLFWIVGHFSLAVVLALTLIDGSLAITSRVLVRATWTSVTTPAGLLRDANAVINTVYSVGFLVGPGVGGAIVSAFGSRGGLLVNVGAFILSTVLVLTARRLPTAAPDRAPVTGRLRSALRYAREDPLIRRLLTLEAAAMVFFAISIPVEVVFAQHTLRAGAGGYGVLLAVWGAGTIAGSAIYARWRKLTSRLLITLGTLLLAAGFAVMAVAPTLAVALLGAVIGGVGNGVQIVAVRTALQEAASEKWMALIVSLNESIFQAVPGLGIVLGGAIAAAAGPRVAFAVGGAGSFAVALAIWRGLRNVEGVARRPISAPGNEAVDDELALSRPR